jgi:hypothetical protein
MILGSTWALLVLLLSACCCLQVLLDGNFIHATLEAK